MTQPIEAVDDYTVKLYGRYECVSGAKFKYYGKAKPWVPGRDTFWEAFVFDEDKRFIHDSFFNSADLRVRLSGANEIPNIPMDAELLRGVAVLRIEETLERWDRER